MKLDHVINIFGLTPSRPAWGAWIEIEDTLKDWKEGKSRPAWGAWIEIPAGRR